MHVEHILSLLTQQRDKLNQAIMCMQEAVNIGTAKHGIALLSPVPKKRTPAQRKAQAEKMRAYWAKRRKEA